MKYLFKKKTLRFSAALLDAAGALLFFMSRRRRPMPKNIKGVLIVRLDHLGDILFTSAVPKLLKEHLEGVRVSFLTSSAGAALLQNNPFVDEVLVYDAPWFERGDRRSGSSFWNTVHRLKKMDLDLALSLRGDLRENFMLWAAGIAERVGYGVTGGGFFLTRELPYRHGAHEREHTLDLLRPLGISARTLQPAVYFTEAEKRPPAERPVGIQLEAGNPAKEWPAGNARKFLSLCFGRFPDIPFVFIGTDERKKKMVDDFLKEHPSLRWKNLIGRTSLREMLYLVSRCRAFIGMDSGPTHAAACFGVPTLFLFSGTNRFEEWRSLEESAEFLRNDVPCSPCALNDCNVKGHPCLSQITPEEVLEALSKMITVLQ